MKVTKLILLCTSGIIWPNKLAYGVWDIPSSNKGKGNQSFSSKKFGSNAIVTFAFSPLKVVNIIQVMEFFFCGHLTDSCSNMSTGAAWSWESLSSIWCNCFAISCVCISCCPWDQMLDLGRNRIQDFEVIPSVLHNYVNQYLVCWLSVYSVDSKLPV